MNFPWLWVKKSSRKSIRRSHLILWSLCLLTACSPSEAQPAKTSGGKPAVPVVTAIASTKTVPTLVKSTGTVQPYATVSVKSQVSGQLISVYFQEGQEVQKGDLLFAIDSRPLQATLDQAIASRARTVAQVSQAQAAVLQAQAQVNQVRANMAKDEAQARNSQVQAQRYAGLSEAGVVSRDQADQFRTNAEVQSAAVNADQSGVMSAIAAVEAAKANLESAEAAVSAADAVIDNAKVQLSFTNIYSPLDGRTGSLKVSQGNLVKDNDANPLVVISQVRPIYVTFSIPQRLLPEVKRYQARGKLTVEIVPAASLNTDRSSSSSSSNSSGRPASPNSASLNSASPTPEKSGGRSPQSPSTPSPNSAIPSSPPPARSIKGELTFVDSTVDVTTGTIQLKANFSNAEGNLTPGQFVNISLKLTEEVNAIVVPSGALQTGQRGTFVYVVKEDKTVEIRPVTPGEAADGQTVIKKGLVSGEQVVTDGQFNLTPGSTIQEKPESSEPDKKSNSPGASPNSSPVETPAQNPKPSK